MSKKSNPLDYLTFNKKQGDNFLKEVEKIVLNELTKTGKQNSIHQFDNNKFKKYGFYVEVINGIKSPLKDYYLLRKDIFNPLSQNTDYVCKAISYKTIEKFMGDYFPNYDLGNPENNAIDIGKLEKITLQEIKERNLNHPNSEVKEIAPVSDTNTHFDPEFIKSRLEKNEYAMYTYGERYINSEGGDDKPRRIFYLKERPVLLKNGQIFLKNTDDIEIVFHPKYRLRKGIK